MKLYTNITENCKNTIARSSRTFAASFSVGEIKYTDIKSLKILVPSAFNGKVGIGGTISNSVEIISGKINLTSGTVIKAYESVLLDSGEYEDIPMGKYRITSAVTKDSLTTIKAEGPLSTETGLGYFSNLEYPATTIQMLNEISDAINVPILVDGLEEIYIDSKPEGYTYREVIGYLAAVHGTNAVETRDGSIALKWYEHCEEDIFTDRADSPDINNELFVIGKLEFTTSNEYIVRGDGKTGIAINNPLVTENIADSIWNKIGGFTYRAATFNIKLGNPCVDIWDCFSYKDETVIATELQYVHDGGLQNVYKSVGESETSANRTKGPLTSKMDRYYAELVLINQALINKLDVDQLDAVEANITSAVIGTIDGRYATFEYLRSNYTSTVLFEALSGRVGTMEANALTADSAIIKNFESEITKTNTLIFGSASGSSIQTEFSNAVIAQLGDAQIKSAMIESITTAQILAGDISTNKHRIISDSGNMILSDNTMQISDGTRVRVQIGKDASADYNMYVWDKYGSLMFDALGLTESGITRQIIRDDVVKDDANISAGKLNIDSLFRVINEDGSHTLKSSKVYLDEKAQTLDIAFSAMSTNVSNLQTAQTSQGTQLSAIQGQITSKIWQEDINTAVGAVEGDVSALSTQYSTLSQSVSGISTTVGNHTSQISGLETRAASSESNYAQLSNQFNWIVKSGTSATNFTLTDRMAELTAAIISLNGNVKVRGDMLVDGTITADKIASKSLTSEQINVKDLFAQDITATGTITGANLVGATISGAIFENNVDSELFLELDYGVLRTKYDYNGDGPWLGMQISSQAIQFFGISNGTDIRCGEIGVGVSNYMYFRATNVLDIRIGSSWIDEQTIVNVGLAQDEGLEDPYVNIYGSLYVSNGISVTGMNYFNGDTMIYGSLTAGSVKTTSGADLDKLNSDLPIKNDWYTLLQPTSVTTTYTTFTLVTGRSITDYRLIMLNAIIGNELVGQMIIPTSIFSSNSYVVDVPFEWSGKVYWMAFCWVSNTQIAIKTNYTSSIKAYVWGWYKI